METRQIHSITDLIRNDTISAKQATYFWKLVDDRDSMIIITGATGAGKTTLLNALASLSNPYSNIETFEDSMELRLNYREIVPAYNYKDKLDRSVRSRAHITIVNEMRNPSESEILFQLAEAGRFTMSTFHAWSIDGAISSLSDEPFNVPQHQLARVHFINIVQRSSGRIVESYRHNGSDKFEITPDMKDDLEHRQMLLHKACANDANSAKILQSYYE